MNFEKVYDKYLLYLSTNLKPTTILFIDRGFKKHILPYFKDKNIFEINNDDIIIWQNYVKNLGFSDSFNYNIQIMFKKFYNYLEDFYSIKNIFKKHNFIKTFNPEENKKLNVWTIKDYKKFIKVVKDPIYHALFNTLYFTGIRKGELQALTFNDLKDNYLCINKSITKELFNNKHLIMTPKTRSSIRKIIIDKKLLKELLKLKKYYKNYSDTFYIFGGINPISCTTLKRKKDYYCKLANVKQIRIHDFRHSHATLLYEKNIKIKTIQERLGHSKIETTIDTYIHNNEKQEKRVLRTLNLIRLK